MQDKDWVMHEYRILSDHYFHEDNYYLKTNAIFMSLNAVMVSFLSGQFNLGAAGFTDGFMLMFSLIGFVSVLAWMLTLLRTHVYRCKIEERIAEIENDFKDILKIRTKRGDLPIYAKLPSSIIILTLPAVFTAIWVFHILAILLK